MTTIDTIPTFEKSIRYDRETRDFRATLDNNYIGHFASYYEAECALDQVAYDLLMDGQCATATELDGGSEPDAMVADHAVVAPANISEPAATTDRQGNTAYAVVVTYQSMPLRYRLHNEWTYGVDCRGAFADSAPMWYGTDMDALNLPAETITALRALWESLFTPSPDAPITPARHWSHDLPAYGADNCAGCGGPVPCRCDDGDDGRTPAAPLLATALLEEADRVLSICPGAFDVCGTAAQLAAACTSTNPCDNPNHNHSTIYTAPILAPALLAEADAALSTCPGAFGPCGAETHPSYAPFCQKCALALQRVAVAAYVQRLADDLGLACSFCGEAHDASDCPLRRPLIVPGPRACGCCGGAHSIQRCSELRAALFAAAGEATAVDQRKQRKPNLIISQGDGWRVEYDRASAMFAAIIDGVGCVGRHAKPHAAQALVRAHRSTEGNAR